MVFLEIDESTPPWLRSRGIDQNIRLRSARWETYLWFSRSYFSAAITYSC